MNFLAHGTGEPIVIPTSVTDVATLRRVAVAANPSTINAPTKGTSLINGFVTRTTTITTIGTDDKFARFPVEIQSDNKATDAAGGILVTVTPLAEVAPALDVDHTTMGAFTAATADTHADLIGVRHLGRGLGVKQ